MRLPGRVVREDLERLRAAPRDVMAQIVRTSAGTTRLRLSFRPTSSSLPASNGTSPLSLSTTAPSVESALVSTAATSPPATRKKRRRELSEHSDTETESVPEDDETKTNATATRSERGKETDGEQSPRHKRQRVANENERTSSVSSAPPSTPRPTSNRTITTDTPLAAALQILLDELIALDVYGFFYRNVTEDEAPSYYSIITHPMSFSTMTEKLHSNQYSDLAAFRADFELICENCMRYNRPNSVYYREAKRLLKEGRQLLESAAKRMKPEFVRPISNTPAAAETHSDVRGATALSNIVAQSLPQNTVTSLTSPSKGGLPPARISDKLKRKYVEPSQLFGDVLTTRPASVSSSDGVLTATVAARSGGTPSAPSRAAVPSLSPTPAAATHALLSQPPSVSTPARLAYNPYVTVGVPKDTSTASVSSGSSSSTVVSSSTALTSYAANYLTFPMLVMKTTTPATPKIVVDVTTYEQSLRCFVQALGDDGIQRVKQYLAEITSPSGATRSSGSLSALSAELSTQLAKITPDALDFSNPLGLTSSDLRALQSLSELGVDTVPLNDFLHQHYYHRISSPAGIKSESSGSAAPTVASASAAGSHLQETLEKSADTIYHLQTLQYERSESRPKATELKLINDLQTSLKTSVQNLPPAALQSMSVLQSAIASFNFQPPSTTPKANSQTDTNVKDCEIQSSNNTVNRTLESRNNGTYSMQQSTETITPNPNNQSSVYTTNDNSTATFCPRPCEASCK
jgi:hypothetical protein